MNSLALHPPGYGLRVLCIKANPFLAVVAKNSPRAGRARLLQGENYV
jgi:hypothetical protein